MMPSMRRQESTSLTDDGVRLFQRSWLLAPKAAVIIVHGYAEHSGRYEQVATHLAEKGYGIYAFDLRGHGRSEGKRAYVRSVDEHVTDLERFVAHVREQVSGQPLFLLGHSMGGTIVAAYLVSRDVDLDGAILSAAALRSARGLARIPQGLISFVGRVAPKLPFAKLSSDKISRDEAVVRAYDNDPLVFRGMMPAGTAAAMIRAMRDIEARPETITLPLLLLHGSADEITKPEGSQELYERAGSTDKTLKLYDGLYHEVLNEPERQRVLDDIVSWLNAHVN